MTDLIELARTIRTRRRAARMSQHELAKKAGVSRPLIAELENERLGEIGFKKLARILNLVGLDLRVADLNQHRPTLDDLRAQDEEDDR